jgi:hypothetical protein
MVQRKEIWQSEVLFSLKASRTQHLTLPNNILCTCTSTSLSINANSRWPRPKTIR